MNWLIIVAAVIVAWLQFTEPLVQQRQGPGLDHPAIRTVPGTPPDPNMIAAPPKPGITETFMLDGWQLKGLLGHMWLHGGLLHLLGNMWFLWIFGNAVCAKVGNFRYLLLYIVFGVAAAVAHLLTSSVPAIGASGAIFGVIGMFLVLFFENRITCYFFFWFIFFRPIIHAFTISSIWMVLFWVFWNVVGALRPEGGSNVAYTAHLGGFAAGFGVALLMCHKGWITMERYEKSLLQFWQQRRQRRARPSHHPSLGRLGLDVAGGKPTSSTPIPAPARPARPVPCLDLNNGAVLPVADEFIHATCSCGKVIKASRQYGGKMVRCPACKGVVLMPESIRPADPAPAGAHDGYIRFTCTCGQKIKMPGRYAGRRGKCPGCGAAIRIPSAR